jgi:single-stranded-DNA-specific exonuclease
MKIIQRGEAKQHLIDTVLSNRKIPNLELFLNPENAEESDPFDFTNTDIGRKLFWYHIINKSKIVILVDADADGYTSSSILYRYIKEVDSNVDLEYIVHDSKAHGLTENVMKEIYEIKPDLVITPDAASNDVEQINELEENNINILVIDHHHVDEFTERGVVINNQLCPMTNINFVGAGVVYKFIKGIDEEQGFDYADKYLDLVAVGQIGDSSDISNPEIRKLVFKGLSKINNPFLKAAIGDIGLKKIIPKDMSFGVIPMINAVTRVGTIEERQLLFEAMAGVGSDRVFNVERKKKNKDTGKFDKIEYQWSIFQYAYDMCSKIKNKQNTIVKKLLPEIEANIVDDCGIIIAVTPNSKYPGITGLVANKLVTKYDKPALLLNKKDDQWTGSGRGHEGTLKDFRKWCEDSNIVEFAQGHDNAFGIGIKLDKLKDFKEYAKNLEKKEVIYEVDILSLKPSKKDCEEIDRHRYLFGGAVDEPLVGLSNMAVPKRFVSTRGSVLNIFSWGMGLVQFNHNPDLFEEIQNYPEDEVILNIVGFYGMNEWGGSRNPQMIIKDIEVVYTKPKEEEITEENIIF